MKKLILWDLDGTLINTLEDLAAAVDYALTLRGLPTHSIEEYRKMVGHGVRNLVKQALEASVSTRPTAIATPTRDNTRTGLTDAYIDAALADFREYYEAHIDVHTRPYPGIPELLNKLNAMGVKMAVASNKFQEGTEKLIQEFFPDIAFVSILGNRAGYPLKPDPEIVQEVLRKAGIGPEDAMKGHRPFRLSSVTLVRILFKPR